MNVMQGVHSIKLDTGSCSSLLYTDIRCFNTVVTSLRNKASL
jgi:hypothetical protein